MRLPWDKNYFKICFYAVLGLSMFYVIKVIIDGFAVALMDIGMIISGVKMIIKDILSIFSPLIMALVIAYLLDPLAEFFQKRFERIYGSPLMDKKIIGKVLAACRKRSANYPQRVRTAGAVLTYIVIFIVLAGLILPVARLGQGSFRESLGVKANGVRNQWGDMLVLIRLKLAEWNIGEGAVDYFNNMLERLGASLLKGGGKEAIGSITAAGIFLGNFVIGFVVAFYLLKRKETLLYKAHEIGKIVLNGRVYQNITWVLGDLNSVFSSYIRGQITDAVIMSVLISGGLKFIGVDFALIIGLLTGFTNLVPFLGAVTGFILSVLMALITGPPIKALYAAVFVLIIQQIDGMFIVPKVVGNRVRLSPAAVILAVAIGGKIAGFTGMVLAVPTCSVIKIWVRRYMDWRKGLSQL